LISYFTASNQLCKKDGTQVSVIAHFRNEEDCYIVSKAVNELISRTKIEKQPETKQLAEIA